MSKNDGGDPIRLRKEPVEKPHIPRGYMLFPPESLTKRPDGRADISWSRDGFQLTAHDVEVLFSGDKVSVDITCATVVTWDRIPSAASQK